MNGLDARAYLRGWRKIDGDVALDDDVVRSAPRRPIAAAVSVREWGSTDEPLPLEIIELSATGVFVSSPFLLPVDTEVELAFSLPGDRPVVVARARVARVEGRADSAGMGIRFESLHPTARAHLEAFAI